MIIFCHLLKNKNKYKQKQKWTKQTNKQKQTQTNKQNKTAYVVLESTHVKSSPLFTFSTKLLDQESPSVHLFYEKVTFSNYFH